MTTSALTLYGIKTCDTCRKARRALEAAGWQVIFVDVREAPLPAETISAWLARFGDSLVNTRSTTWRNMDAADRAASPQAQIQANPSLMKRPVIATTDALYLGWSKEVQEALL